MQRWRSISTTARAWIAVAILAGCAGNGASQLAPTNNTTNSVLQIEDHRVDPFQTLIAPRNVRPNLNRRIVDEPVVKLNCCALQKTAFISDAFGGSSFTGAIYMFDYVTGAPLGQVAQPPEGFLEVQGGCADNNGNVYFTNTSLSTIDEYDHGGTYLATLSDPGEYPAECSYDKATGDLAVANVLSTSGGKSNLAIFHGGVRQHIYYPPNMTSVESLAYQGTTGRLWIDGSNASGFQLYYFKNGRFTFVRIHGGTIRFGGGLMWSEKTNLLNVGDQSTFSVTTYAEVDDSGDIKGYVNLTCTQQSDICDVVQATIKGPGLVAPDAVLLSSNRFAYPAGGPPVLNYPAPYVQPIGSAVSANKQ